MPLASLPFEPDPYLYGRCHLYALVAAKMVQQPIMVLWDLDAEDEAGGYIPEPCLVHAYVEIKKGTLDLDGERCTAFMDAQGIIELDDAPLNCYPCNTPHHQRYSIQDFEALALKKWGGFNRGEEAQLQQHVAHVLSGHAIDLRAR